MTDVWNGFVEGFEDAYRIIGWPIRIVLGAIWDWAYEHQTLTMAILWSTLGFGLCLTFIAWHQAGLI